jgi:hypothetical protein
MAALDDSRHRDTVPPLTLWQMMQITPFMLFLREYFTAPCQLANLLLFPNVGNYASLL